MCLNIQNGCSWFMNFQIFDWWTQWIGTLILSLIARIQRLKIHVGVYDVLESILNLEMRSSNSALWWFNDRFRHAALLMLCLLKTWSVRILECVLGYCFGCSLQPGTPLNSPWKLASSVLSWSLTLPIQEQQQSCCSRPYACSSSTYSRRRIPDFLRMVIKLAVCLPVVPGFEFRVCCNLPSS